jgi:hypothetical protein
MGEPERPAQPYSINQREFLLTLETDQENHYEHPMKEKLQPSNRKSEKAKNRKTEKVRE